MGAMDAGYTALLSLFTASRRGANRPISAMAHPLARAAQRCLARTMNRGSGNEVRSTQICPPPPPPPLPFRFALAGHFHCCLQTVAALEGLEPIP